MKCLTVQLLIFVFVLGLQLSSAQSQQQEVQHVVPAPAPGNDLRAADDVRARKRARRRNERKSRSGGVVNNHLQLHPDDDRDDVSENALQSVNNLLRGIATDVTSLRTQLSNFKFEHQMLHEQVRVTLHNCTKSYQTTALHSSFLQLRSVSGICADDNVGPNEAADSGK